MNKQRILLISLLSVLLTLFSCDDRERHLVRQSGPSITVITSTGNLGDNGYNDLIFEGIIHFATKNDLSLSLVSPKDKQEAQGALQEWITARSYSEKSLLIMASSEYETLFTSNFPEIDKSKNVLLFESDKKDMPEGVFTLSLRRYGASYLCGSMASECPEAYVIAACPNDSTINLAIKGFQQGYKTASGKTAEIIYLSDDADGYSNPEDAYSVTKSLPDNAFIFPLAGGSNNGIYKFVRENMFTGILVAGMDVDCSPFYTRTPYSLILNIDEVLNDFLDKWLEGKIVDKHTEGGLSDGFVNVNVNSTFFENIIVWEEYYDSVDYWQRMYDKYYQSAIDAERSYYEK